MTPQNITRKEMRDLIEQSADKNWSLSEKIDTFGWIIPPGYIIQNDLSPKELDFLWYHAENPTIFKRMLAHIQSALNRGHQKLSPWLIMNLIRWEETMSVTRTTEEFMIPNHCIGYYSRMAMCQPSVPDDFFNTRSLKPGV